jgi:hypothetical protein
VPVQKVFEFGLAVSIAAPALICPLISWKVSLAVRERDRLHAKLHEIAATDQLERFPAGRNRWGLNEAATAAGASGDFCWVMA